MIHDTPIQKTLCFLSIIWLYSLGHWVGGTILLLIFVATIKMWPKVPIEPVKPKKGDKPLVSDPVRMPPVQ